MKTVLTILAILFLTSIVFPQTMHVDTKSGRSSFDISLIDSITFISYPPLPIDSLVAYYPFNDSANDESGKGNNGIVSGAMPSADRFGVSNRAYLFNGVDNSINIPNSTTLNINGHVSITLCAWINPDTIGIEQCVISKWGAGGSEDDQFLLGYVDNGGNTLNTIGFQLSDASTYLQCSTQFLPRTWYFVCAVYDADNDMQKIYVNGVLDTQQSLNTTIQSTSQMIAIGTMEGVAWPFDGAIDDIRIFNRALSGSEIQDLYDVGGWK